MGERSTEQDGKRGDGGNENRRVDRSMCEYKEKNKNTLVGMDGEMGGETRFVVRRRRRSRWMEKGSGAAGRARPKLVGFGVADYLPGLAEWSIDPNTVRIHETVCVE